MTSAAPHRPAQERCRAQRHGKRCCLQDGRDGGKVDDRKRVDTGKGGHNLARVAQTDGPLHGGWDEDALPLKPRQNREDRCAEGARNKGHHANGQVVGRAFQEHVLDRKKAPWTSASASA